MVDLGCTGRKDGQTDSTRTREKKERQKEPNCRALLAGSRKALRTQAELLAERQRAGYSTHYGESKEQQKPFLCGSEYLKSCRSNHVFQTDQKRTQRSHLIRTKTFVCWWSSELLNSAEPTLCSWRELICCRDAGKSGSRVHSVCWPLSFKCVYREITVVISHKWKKGNCWKIFWIGQSWGH